MVKRKRPATLDDLENSPPKKKQKTSSSEEKSNVDNISPQGWIKQEITDGTLQPPPKSKKKRKRKRKSKRTQAQAAVAKETETASFKTWKKLQEKLPKLPRQVRESENWPQGHMQRLIGNIPEPLFHEKHKERQKNIWLVTSHFLQLCCENDTLVENHCGVRTNDNQSLDLVLSCRNLLQIQESPSVIKAIFSRFDVVRASIKHNQANASKGSEVRKVSQFSAQFIVDDREDKMEILNTINEEIRQVMSNVKTKTKTKNAWRVQVRPKESMLRKVLQNKAPVTGVDGWFADRNEALLKKWEQHYEAPGAGVILWRNTGLEGDNVLKLGITKKHYETEDVFHLVRECRQVSWKLKLTGQTGTGPKNRTFDFTALTIFFDLKNPSMRWKLLKSGEGYVEVPFKDLHEIFIQAKAPNMVGYTKTYIPAPRKKRHRKQSPSSEIDDVWVN